MIMNEILEIQRDSEFEQYYNKNWDKYLINKKFLNDEFQIIYFICDTLNDDDNLQNRLLIIIEQSKYIKESSIAASNAMTILNTNNFSFSKMDLSHINVSFEID